MAEESINSINAVLSGELSNELVSMLQAARVVANILIGANGATTLDEKSSPLRTAEDGARFHAIRKLAKVVLIGGNTFRSEPYQKSALPVMVSSNTLTPRTEANLVISKLPPQILISEALDKFSSPILIEGGPQFVTPLLREKLIDLFLISRSPACGDGNFFPVELLEENYEKVQSEIKGLTNFEIWSAKP